MEAFPLDVGFLLPPIAGDPAAAEDPGQAEALPPAAAPAVTGSDAAPALTALARQVLQLHDDACDCIGISRNGQVAVPAGSCTWLL
jgi:hypothetical protein